MERFRGTPQLQITRKVPRYKHQGPTTEDKLARIDHLSRTARQHWLVLITFLGFVTVTLFGVEHIDFFLPSRKTDLPLIGVSIPTAYFFYCAPILVMLLFCYLHVHLMKLWKEMTIIWNEESGPLGDKLPSWLVSDLVIWARHDITKDPMPLQPLVNKISGFVIFWATPLILSIFWWKSMPAREEWMTLTIAACFVVSCVFASKSRRFFKISLAKKKPFIGNVLWVLCVSVLILAVIAISWLRTERGFDQYYKGAWSLDYSRSCKWVFNFVSICNKVPLAATDISDQNFVAVPSWWDSYENLKLKFYKKNCSENVDEKSCFAQWDKDYKEMLRRIPKLNLKNKDARGANISYSYLMRSDLSGAKLQDANLKGAQLQGADLTFAQLQGANLDEAQLQEANFHGAKLQNASLDRAQLQGADLFFAYLQDADLTGAQLQGADLTMARLQKANLKGAQLQGANLHRAELEWTYLRRAELQGANLTEANLQNANFKYAQLQETNFSEAQLQGAIFRVTELQGADFTRAQLQGANLTLAQAQGADLTLAELQGADLRWAELQGANFHQAKLQGADLTLTKLQGADLTFAQLQGTDLTLTKLQGADLSLAELQGANLHQAQLQGADLRKAQLQGADLHKAQLQGADLHQAQLQGADLHKAQLQGTDLSRSILVASSGLTQQSVQFAVAQDLSDKKTMLPLVPMSDTFELMKLKQCYSFLDVAYLRSTYCHFCYNGMDITTFEKRLEKLACPLIESD